MCVACAWRCLFLDHVKPNLVFWTPLGSMRTSPFVSRALQQSGAASLHSLHTHWHLPSPFAKPQHTSYTTPRNAPIHTHVYYLIQRRNRHDGLLGYRRFTFAGICAQTGRTLLLRAGIHMWNVEGSARLTITPQRGMGRAGWELKCYMDVLSASHVVKAACKHCIPLKQSRISPVAVITHRS